MYCKAVQASLDTNLKHGNEPDFHELTMQVLLELDGSYGLLCRSVHYPNEVIATRKGSPLLIGVKSERKLKVDFVDVEFPDTDEAQPEIPLNSTRGEARNFLPIASNESALIYQDQERDRGGHRVIKS